MEQDLRLPCCTYAALVLHYGMTGTLTSKPSFAKGEMTAGKWGDLNIWNADKPWSNIEAVADWVGGTIQPPTVAPEFTPGKWHYVQCWKYLELDGTVGAASTGHTYLIWDAGDHHLMVESSVGKGFRTTHGKHSVKPRYLYSVVTLDETPWALENAIYTIPFGADQ